MRRIIFEGEIWAVIVTEEDFRPGVNFLTPPDWPFQLGVMVHPAGHVIRPHRHLEQPGRTVAVTQEFLWVVSGQMEVDFYDSAGSCFHTEKMIAGEALLHVKGGHGFRFSQPTRIVEVKQGPFSGRASDKQDV